MQATQYQKQNDDPHDVLVVAPDAALVVPTDEELSRLAQTMRQSSDPRARAESDHAATATIPPVDTTFRPTVSDAPGRGRTIGGRAARGFTAALLLALCTGAAAFAWEGYGDEGKSMIAQWVPQRVLALVLPLEKPAPAEQPTPPAVEAAAVDTPPAQPAPSPPAAPEAAAPAAAPSVEPAEQLRSMARDLASAGQQIEQLKASIEDLKASQQQMSREIAKASEAKASEAKASEARPSEQNLRPKMSALPPRPAPARARKPTPPLPHPQAATYPATPQTAAPYVPQQAEPPPQATTQTLSDPELAAVPRPPMPVR
jgi:hypothetical protein